MSLDFRDIQDILRLLDDSPYDALDLRTGRFHLTLRRQGGSWTQETRSLGIEAGAAAGTQPAGERGGEASTQSVEKTVDEAATAPAVTTGGEATTPPAGAMAQEASTQPAGTQGSLHAAPVASSPQAPVSASGPSGNAGPRPFRAQAVGIPAVGLVAAANSAVAPVGAGAAASSPAAASTGLLEVRAPMPGTFYRAPQPGAAPFVSVGERVEAGTAIGIIEVMKLMSTIPAGQRGTVAEILAEDASFVEKGQVLLRVRPESA